MPQLVKGGKYVYGWVNVRKGGSIMIPEEAYFEYGFIQDEYGFILSGSKRSGGFGLTSKRFLKNSIIGENLIENQYNSQKLSSSQIKAKKGKLWMVKIDKDRFIALSEHIMRVFDIKIGDRLLVIRGSGLALGFVNKGPIFKEAEKHFNHLK